MEIKIRNVDPVAIKKIDEIAKRKNISRQEFLKGQIEGLAYYREENERETYLTNVLEKNIKIMEKCNESMEKMNAFINEMISDDYE
ncbi:hypothetical protein [Priestia megaterium]|uniref:hypothetical protein n=1 Tax=Priestia megaterium TaxID=1404 RepID=UPI0027961DDF|nr:hypothetical protein [Priestia megaterium]